MPDPVRLEAAAKAAFPELWGTPNEEVPLQHRAQLTFARQRALDTVTAAVTAYEEAVTATVDAEPGDEGQSHRRPLAEMQFALPEDAAMVQQVLTVVTYIDNDGSTAYTVQTNGNGLKTTWLGMTMLAQDYLLRSAVWESGDED